MPDNLSDRVDIIIHAYNAALPLVRIKMFVVQFMLTSSHAVYVFLNTRQMYIMRMISNLKTLSVFSSSEPKAPGELIV